MHLDLVAPGHLFQELRIVWLFFVRAECTCGYRTRPHLTCDGASNALILHQARIGVRLF